MTDAARRRAEEIVKNNPIKIDQIGLHVFQMLYADILIEPIASAISEAVREERERCANIADSYQREGSDFPDGAAIRDIILGSAIHGGERII